MDRKVTFLFVFLVTLSFASSATIHGSIYDFSIKKVKNAVVQINTNPKQRMVAVNGSYVFHVPNGSYLVTAEYFGENLVYTAEENITVVDEGQYVIDLFLYPVVDEEIYEDIELNIDNPYEDESGDRVWIIVAPFVFVLGIIGFLLFQKNKDSKQETGVEKLDRDLKKIITLLKKNSNRMTQKEIRKEMPVSQAKISLMLTELEDRGFVKKIKRGRGNIIIFKKR